MISSKDLEIVQRIKKYCLNISDLRTNFTQKYSDFENSEIYQAAAGMFVMQIGECAKNLSNEFKLEHLDIPWHKIVGLRNIYAHEYHHIDDAIIWETINKRIPEVEVFCDKIIQQSQKLHTTEDITAAIISEFQNNNDLNTVEKNITSKIDAPSNFEKKIKFKTALKHACKNRSIRKIVEKEQELER